MGEQELMDKIQKLEEKCVYYQECIDCNHGTVDIICHIGGSCKECLASHK